MKMNRLIMAAAAAVALMTAATSASAGDWTVSARGGQTDASFDNFTTLGVGAAYSINDYFGAEVTYDRVLVDNFDDINAVSLNATARYPLTEKINVTAAAGIGYAEISGFDDTTWTVGAGLEYEATDSIVLEARFRRTEGFDTGLDFNTYTVGAGYRF